MFLYTVGTRAFFNGALSEIGLGTIQAENEENAKSMAVEFVTENGSQDIDNVSAYIVDKHKSKRTEELVVALLSVSVLASITVAGAGIPENFTDLTENDDDSFEDEDEDNDEEDVPSEE